MKKKSIAMLLLLVLIISCLAGCGKKSDSSSTGGDSKAGNGQKEETDGSGDTENNEGEAADPDNPYAGIDISKPVEITMYVLGGSEPTDKDKVVAAINEKLKEKVNAQLNLQVIPLSEYATRYPLILSGGETQRLLLAHCFYSGRSMLVMDEPSSALDPMAESDFNTRTAELSEDKMVIFVTHRLSAVHMADCIYVIDDGRLAGKGSHNQLLKEGGVYQEMWNAKAMK